MKTLRLADLPEVLTPEQVADLLQISRSKVYGMVQNRKLPKVRGIGHTVRIPRAAIERMVQVTP